MKAPVAASTGLAPLTVTSEAMVRSPFVETVTPPVVATPPVVVPAASANEPMVRFPVLMTVRSPALAASVPIWLPPASSVKEPGPVSSNPPVEMAALCVTVPLDDSASVPGSDNA